MTTSSLPAGRWRVLVDAAKACGSVPPDLSQHAADFVALSFYKMFGYPTGRVKDLGWLRRPVCTKQRQLVTTQTL
jgi:hypothetical protein